MIDNIKYILIVLTVVMICENCTGVKTRSVNLSENTIEKLITSTPANKKIKFLVGACKAPFNPPEAAPGTIIRTNISDNISKSLLYSRGKVKGAAGETFSDDELSIPSLIFADGPSGVRIEMLEEDSSDFNYSTSFPIATSLAATWNKNLVCEVGRAISAEALEKGVDVLLAPAMNIQRDPLGGRNFEYYSEDPVLSGIMAASMIKGIQGNGVAATAKHFVSKNQETYRNGIDVCVSERALREIYLKGFFIALNEGNPWAIMTSYNKVNGDYMSESELLLNKVLRNEWGYKGVVMTDWWAENDPVSQINAGTDLIMPGSDEQITKLFAGYNQGLISDSTINNSFERYLKLVAKLPNANIKPTKNITKVDNQASLSKSAAEEGMVLLQNNQALPLIHTKSIALFGNSSYDLSTRGTGSGFVYSPYKINLDEGLLNNNISIDDSLANLYRSYLSQQKNTLLNANFWYTPRISEMNLKSRFIEYLSRKNDLAIFTINRQASEGSDRKLENDFYLSPREKDLLSKISHAFHRQNKKVVVVLNIGGVIETASWKNMADAILISWLPGQEGGNAIAELLKGVKSPSGKLPMTFPIDYNDAPSFGNFPMSENNPSVVDYNEDIYVGYRYYLTKNVKASFDFGYGLSYTNFTYSNMRLAENPLTDSIEIKVSVKNTGRYAAKETVQLYITAPKVKLAKPICELKAFAKTNELKPGDVEDISLNIAYADLASYDNNRSSWIVDQGTYELKVGASCSQIFISKPITVSKEIALVNKLKI